MPNRLANETSPYLLQHKDNPVDWYAWGDEAFAAARAADKPVILSVGYSACHWCHVMEHESFENDAIAKLMNDNFVSIKVDREERPDIDAIYMQAVQALTQRGGWPMTVFMTPEGLPFYGGTYYPPEDRQGMPGFPRVLSAVTEAYRTRRNELQAAGEQLRERLATPGYVRPGDRSLEFEVLDNAFDEISRAYDPDFGGFGRAPKFPQPMTLEFLLRQHHRTRNEHALEMVMRTLDAMAFGGMYDQVGGGFHRYSTDAIWLVPHFEKMLYDNALLARVYLDAFKVTGLLRYRRITEETLHYVLREMTDSTGAFYSTQDADSEGEEGKFFLWTPAELAEVLGEDSRLVGEFFGVTEGGNFEAKNILHVPRDPERFATSHDISLEGLTRLIGEAKLKLYEAREHRVHPARDDKVLTAWNGLMLRAFAEAGFTFDEPRYIQVAMRNADFLLATMRPNGRLLRTWKPAASGPGDGVAKLNGYLEDYANLIDGLLATHTASFEPRFLSAAIELADEMIDLFWDPETEGFFDTGRDHETLITRPRDLFDNASPAGTSVAADVLLRLTAITGDETYEQRAVACLRAAAPIVEQAPTAFGRLLCTLDYHLARSLELAIVLAAAAAAAHPEALKGSSDPVRPEALEGPAGPEARALADILRGVYLPHIVIVGGRDGAAGKIALLQDRPARDGQPTAYLCERFVCQAPTTEAEELRRQLQAS
jgi:uncharacterized protein YyaL (SSP411 family)